MDNITFDYTVTKIEGMPNGPNCEQNSSAFCCMTVKSGNPGRDSVNYQKFSAWQAGVISYHPMY
jgi:hypothetical protein